MKKVILFIFILLYLCSIVPANPVMVFEKTEHHCGTMMQNTQMEFCFAFRNKGDSVLKVIQYQTFCHCTILEDPLSDEIKPGEKGYIKGVFTTENAKGEVERSIEITTNEGENAKHYLTIKADITEVFAIEPQNTMVLPAIAGQPDIVTKEITVRSIEGKPFIIKEITSKVDFLSGRVIKEKTIDKGEKKGNKKGMEEMQTGYKVQATIDRSKIPRFGYFYVAVELIFCMEFQDKERGTVEQKSLILIFHDQAG
ncbi:MAG: DUF1573 domain-containing protein [Spirochaetales bacterium]|nr:DUF1573 domain-containing protein [Spirochaetales bacterium]